MTTLADIWRENERNATERRCRIGMVYTQFALLPDPETGTIQPTRIAPTKGIDGVKLTIQPRLAYQYPFKREREPDCITCNDDPARCQCDDVFTIPDESRYCAVCECHNGHSLTCATLNVRGDVINH